MKISVLPTLLHIVIILCLSVQESLEQSNNNDNLQLPLRNHSQGISTTTNILLFSRATKRYLRIMGRTVDVLGEKWDEFAKLIVRTDNFGSITIQGDSSKYYLCINRRGSVIGRKKIKRKEGSKGSVNCVFNEIISYRYTELRSVQTTDMYLGFNQHGQSLNARRTRPGVRFVQFLLLGRNEDTHSHNDQSAANSHEINRFIEAIEDHL